MAEKAALRERFRAVRRSLSPETHAEASRAVCARVLALPEVEAARTVHLFWPAVDRGEVDVRPLAAALRQRDVAVVLPAVASAPGEAPRLAHRLFEGEGRLVVGRWGLAEPAPDAPAVSVTALDVVVVPALAADRDGQRLGYGGGFYDAFLAETPALRVGVVFDEALVDRLPAEPHDAPLHVIVTPSEVVRTGVQTRNPGG